MGDGRVGREWFPFWQTGGRGAMLPVLAAHFFLIFHHGLSLWDTPRGTLCFHFRGLLH